MENHCIVEFKEIGKKEIGYLISLEENKNISFNTKRVYYTYGVPNNVQRGFHAHKTLKQMLVCVNGSLNIKCEDSLGCKVYNLDNPKKGLYIGENVWHEMYDYSKDTVLMVLASEHYDENDYIRNYEDFLCIIKER